MLTSKFFIIIESLIKELAILILPIRKQYFFDIPYFSQWENKELVKDIVEKKVEAIDDKLWQSSGAKSKEEYNFWSWHMCGMACLKMILKKETGKIYPIIKLGKKATKHNTYIVQNNDIAGLFYQPFCQFLKREFNITCSYAPHMSLKRVLHEFSNDNYVITSVHPSIRYAKNKREKHSKTLRGGHLVLVTGYDLEKKKIYFHNPSGFYQYSQKNFGLDFYKFKKYFAFRGIILTKNEIKN